MTSPGPANPFLDATAGDLIAAAAARAPDHEAIVAADRRITYREFHAEACRFARALLAHGVGRDDKVAIWLPNRSEWLFAQYGAALIGAVIVGLNPRFKIPRHVRIVDDVPRTPGPHGDKVQKARLREMFLAEPRPDAEQAVT